MKTKQLSFFFIFILIITCSFILIQKSNRNLTQYSEKLESIFTELNNNNKSLDRSLYFMTNSGQTILTFKNSSLQILDSSFQLKEELLLPFKRSDIHKIYVSPNDNNIVVFCNSNNSQTIINRYNSKKAYTIDLNSLVCTEITSKSHSILEHNGFQNSDNNLYIKYVDHDDDTTHYGFIDITTVDFTSIVELNNDNYFDIYIAEKLVAKVKLYSHYYKVLSLNDTLIDSQEIRKSHIEETDFLSPLQFQIEDDCIYYIDRTSSKYGSLIKFDLKDNHHSTFIEKLSGDVKDFKILKSVGIIVYYGYDGYETFYPFNDEKSPLDAHFSEKKMRTATYQISNDSSVLMYYKINDDFSSEVVYKNLETNKSKKLINNSSSSMYYKTEHVIKDNHEKDIHFYSYTHDDTFKRPVVILLHGGPFTRFNYSTKNDQAIILKECGFNVIELNYHGSENLGMYYRNYSESNLPQKAINNIDYLIKWFETQQNMDKNKVIVVGTSFGGYLSMLAKFQLKEKIQYSVALVPSSFNDLTKANITEYSSAVKDPYSYDNWKLAENTDQHIGIIFNPYDPKLAVMLDWNHIGDKNPNVEILETINTDHTVRLDKFKTAVYSILENIDSPYSLSIESSDNN